MLVRNLVALKDPRVAPHVVALGLTNHPGDGPLPEKDTQELVKNGVRFLKRAPGWGNGGHWGGGMMKVGAIRTMLEQGFFTDEDYVLCVDSDSLIISSEIFDDLENAGIAGPMQDESGRPWTTRFGRWSQVSGCCMFIRGDIARTISAFTVDECTKVFNELNCDGLALTEDIIVTYLANCVGAQTRSLNKHMAQDLEACMVRGERKGSVWHFNMPAGNFLGVQVTGKWDIPRTLASMGLSW